MTQRIGRAWRALAPDQRLAAIAALALLGSMILPWYQETGNAIVDNRLSQIDDAKSAFQVYSFVEAAIFLVAIGVLALLWARAERRTFHLPFGDGGVIMGAGAWVMLLIFYRQLDKPDGRRSGPISTSVGVEWGIFIAFVIAAVLTYAGYRIRAAHIPEPPPPRPPRRPREPATETMAPIAGEPASASDREAAPSRPTPSEKAAQPAAQPSDEPGSRPAAHGRRQQSEGQLSFDEPAEFRPPPRR